MKKPSKPVSFFGTNSAKTAADANAAVFGAPHGTPYPAIDNRVHAGAADAFRKALAEDSAWIEHFDWDFDEPLLPDPAFRAVDLGNLKTAPKDGAGNRKKIEAQTRGIVAAGAVPVMFGGDDSVPIPFLSGFSDGPAITILQIDAHIDWREERDKERFGFSSTMRRASEMEHVWRIVQTGARGIGSARTQDVTDARNWGARFVPARRLHLEGSGAVLEQIDEGSDCVICLDLDVLDSSVMPAVAYPSTGGLSFLQLTELIAGVAAKAKIAGFAMVEFVPKRDLSGTAAFTAGRIAAHVLGHVARQTAKDRS
jgi:agmatinase